MWRNLQKRPLSRGKRPLSQFSPNLALGGLGKQSVHNTTATTKQVIQPKNIIITKNVDRTPLSSS